MYKIAYHTTRASGFPAAVLRRQRPLKLVRVDVRKHLFNLLFIRLEFVSVGDKKLGAQERRDVEDFHLLGL